MVSLKNASDRFWVRATRLFQLIRANVALVHFGLEPCRLPRTVETILVFARRGRRFGLGYVLIGTRGRRQVVDREWEVWKQIRSGVRPANGDSNCHGQRLVAAPLVQERASGDL